MLAESARLAGVHHNFNWQSTRVIDNQSHTMLAMKEHASRPDDVGRVPARPSPSTAAAASAGGGDRRGGDSAGTQIRRQSNNRVREKRDVAAAAAASARPSAGGGSGGNDRGAKQRSSKR